MAWVLGNTTLRNPYRIRDGAIALSRSPLNGNLSGTRNEQEFALLLYSLEVVKPSEDVRGDIAIAEKHLLPSTHSIPLLGRKWRSALAKLGFIDSDTFAITASGQRLISAEKEVQQQDCYLRALAGFRDGVNRSFSPLHFVLQIIHRLEETEKGQGYITFAEMAAAVETREDMDELDAAVAQILRIRHRREQAKQNGRVRQFEESLIEDALAENGLTLKVGTLRDYADTNVRYLKATGLFVSRSRGIMLDPKKVVLAKLLAQQDTPPLTEADYFAQLYAGALLPTDQKDQAVLVIEDLLKQLAQRGAAHRPQDLGTLGTQQLEQLRLGLQEELRNLDELDFANRQADEIEEILGWLQALQTSRAGTLNDGRKL